MAGARKPLTGEKLMESKAYYVEKPLEELKTFKHPALLKERWYHPNRPGV